MDGASGNFQMRGGQLTARLVTAKCASAQIVKCDAGKSLELDGVAAVLLAKDFGAANASLPWRVAEPLLAEEKVEFYGQPLALIVAESEQACRAAEEVLELELHTAPGVLSVSHAVAVSSFHGDDHQIVRGDVTKAMTAAPNRIEGKLVSGTQAPFGRQTLWAEAQSSEDGREVQVTVPAEAPSRVRSAVAGAVGIPESAVTVVAVPLSGVPGGKEVEAGEVAALVALAALRTGRPVRLELSRQEDVAISGKRAEVESKFAAGFDERGQLLAVDVEFFVDAGWTVGDSVTTRDRILLHADGAYHVADFRAVCRLCRTHRVVTAALPAEGALQASLVIEEILSRIAHRLSLPLEEVRSRNFYRGDGEQTTTHYGQTVDADSLHKLWSRLVSEADVVERRKSINAWNAANPAYKRGLGIVPVKLGVGDPRSDRNQGSATVQIFVDGSVVVNLGLADSGDGISRQICSQVAGLLGVQAAKIRVHCGNLDAVPHSTVAHGVDSAGLAMQAVSAACAQLKGRLRPVALQMLTATTRNSVQIDEDSIVFRAGQLQAGGHTLTLEEVVGTAWRKRVDLCASGHYRTPKLWWDAEIGGGWPFEYFAKGAAVAEVQLDAFTGEVQLLRADLLLESGASLTPDVDRVRATRAFHMGVGWQINESLHYDKDGKILNAAEQFLIPGFADSALDFRIATNAGSAAAIAAGKPVRTVAESPVVLSVAVREAVREAIRAFGAGPDVEVELSVPATPEAVLGALRDLSKHVAAASREAANAKAAADAQKSDGSDDGKSR